MKTCAEVAKKLCIEIKKPHLPLNLRGFLDCYISDFESCSDFPKDHEPMTVWAVSDGLATAVFKSEAAAKEFADGPLSAKPNKIVKLQEVKE